MRRPLLMIALTASMVLPSITNAQQATKPSRSAVIDMQYVFKNYKKFEDERSKLREQVLAAEQQMQGELKQLKVLQQQFSALKVGSPEYQKKEAELAGKAADLEASRQVLRRDFARKEAALYREVYIEVTDAVKKYATYYNYNMVIRHTRDELSDIGNPQSAMQSMNRQVVFHSPEDDISESVLDFLNKQYAGEKKPK